MSTSIEISTEINHWTERALSTYRFLVQLPSPLSNILFKRIVDESFNVVSTFPKAARIDIALDGICNAIDLNCDDFSPLLAYFGISYIEKNEIDVTIANNNRKEIKEKLKSSIKLRDLPTSEDLVDSYLCFSQTILDDNVLVNYKEIVRDKLNRIAAKYGKSFFSSSKSVEINPFQSLGYKTYLPEWFNDETDRNMDVRFFRWYCKGDLLSFYFDSIFRGESTPVAYVLWQYINNACEKDPFLKDLAQEQYEEYRRFMSSTPPHEFLFKGDKSKDVNVEILKLLPALPRFAKDNNKNGYLNDNEMYALYEKLVDHGYLDREETPIDAFLKVFSGTGRSARAIKWHGSQRELATFLAEAQGGVTSKKYSQIAASLFLQKNGKPCKITTLNQPDYSITTFRNIREEILNK